MGRTRTLLVASNDDFLDSVSEWMDRDARIEVVGRSHTGSEALERVEELRVELVLVDVTLPDMSGFEVARRIKSRVRAPLVVLLSFFDGQAVRQEAWAAGADGIVAKPDMIDRLTTLVASLVRGSEQSRSATYRDKPVDVIQPTGEETGERGSS